MREVQASEAKAHLPSLLDAVERGETVIITRHGKPIARIVPEADRRRRIRSCDCGDRGIPQDDATHSAGGTPRGASRRT